MRFYEALGYSYKPQFTDETAACIVISDTILCDAAHARQVQDIHSKGDRRRDKGLPCVA